MSDLFRDQELIDKLAAALKEDSDNAYEHLYNLLTMGMITLAEFVAIIKKSK